MNLKHCILAGLIFAGSPVIHAQTLNFDIFNYGTGSTYTGLGAATDLSTNTFWNDIKSAPSTVGSTDAPNLLSDGATSSPVTLTVGAPGGFYENFSATPTLLNPYYYIGSTPATLTLNNVAAGTYDLYLYGINSNYASDATTFTVNGVPQSVVSTSAGADGFVLGNNYVEFTGVTPTLGTIDISYVADSDAGATEGAFNGLQLQTAPEPGLLSMLSLGLSSLLFLTWLRSRSQRI